jgi:uncharacterized RDD family membrane protein YckC
MSEGSFFASEFAPAHAQHRWRLWGADLVDLGTAALVGWGAVRALDLEQSPWAVLMALGGAWGVLSLVGGVRGWTLGRRLLDVRLVAEDGRAPGLLRALARALTVPWDVFMMPLLPSRPLDRLLGVHGEQPAAARGNRVRGLALQFPWVAALAAAGWFIFTPTRHEAFTFLDTKLTGWKCCHGYKNHKGTWMCQQSLARLSREAEHQHPRALALMPECPEASSR